MIFSSLIFHMHVIEAETEKDLGLMLSVEEMKRAMQFYYLLISRYFSIKVCFEFTEI